MTPINRRTAIKLTAAGVGALALKPVASFAQATPLPFGAEFPELDALATGEWWTKGTGAAAAGKSKNKGKGQPPPPPPLTLFPSFCPTPPAPPTAMRSTAPCCRYA